MAGEWCDAFPVFYWMRAAGARPGADEIGDVCANHHFRERGELPHAGGGVLASANGPRSVAKFCSRVSKTVRN